MRVLLFHGYMLRGTGSNIYNANLARALARLGHEVHLLCQDREVEIEGVEIHNPDIGGLLPVYVKDPYEGFEVKAFPELTEEELDRYIEANVAAVREVAERRRRHRRRPRQPPGDGPGDPRPRRRRPLRGQDPRLGARVHGQAAPALPALRRRGDGGRLAASWSAPRHTAESLWAALPDVPGLRGEDRGSARPASTSTSSGRGDGWAATLAQPTAAASSSSAS